MVNFRGIWNSAKKLVSPRFFPTTSTPILQITKGMKSPFVGDVKKNRYQRHRELLEKDPELYGAINRLALMCAHAYKGVVVHAGHSLDEKEIALKKAVEAFEKTMDFKELFYVISFHLLRDGDDVWVSLANGKQGIVQLQPLPIEYLTAVEKKEQIGQITTEVITGANFYILEELNTSKRRIFPENHKQAVWHFALNNRAELVEDILGRKTFGVWSLSPLDSLRDRVLWKQLIVLTDALVRNKIVPREIFKVDLSSFSPEFFEGETLEDRLDAARKAAKKYAEKVAKDFGSVPAGRGYVIDKTSDVELLEPSGGVKLASETLQDRINRSIADAFGLTYERGTYATELVALSYAVLLPQWIVYRIKTKLLEIIREHIALSHRGVFSEEDFAKVDLKTSLNLDIMKGELIRMVAVLASTGIATRQELRAMLDMDPLTEDQLKDLWLPPGKGGRSGDFAQTVQDIQRDWERRKKTPEPITPESRHDKQVT